MASLLMAVICFQPLSVVIAETGTSTQDGISEPTIEDEPLADTEITATSTTVVVPPASETFEIDSVQESVRSTSTEAVTTTHEPALDPAPGVDSGNLETLSKALADMFTAEQAPLLPLTTEVIPVYDLNVPIVIPVEPLQAVIVPDTSVSATLLERVVDTVSSWVIGGDAVTPTEYVPPENGSVPTVPPESMPAELPVSNQPEDVPASEESQAWWSLFTTVFAAEESIDQIPPVTAEVAIGSTTNTLEVTSLASTTNTATTTEAVDETHSTTIVSLVRLGTTSIDASIERDDQGAYTIVIPPGALPLGIHELHIATTTSDGEINERVVVDVGGGSVKVFVLDEQRDVLVTMREDGQSALWLRQRSEWGSAIISLAPYGTFYTDSPLAFFDETLFYLTSEAESLVGYDVVSGVSFSQTINGDGLAVEIPLRGGTYYVTPNELDFQFVSAVDAVY